MAHVKAVADAFVGLRVFDSEQFNASAGVAEHFKLLNYRHRPGVGRGPSTFRFVRFCAERLMGVSCGWVSTSLIRRRDGASSVLVTCLEQVEADVVATEPGGERPYHLQCTVSTDWTPGLPVRLLEVQ